jgi:hypothetical protein
VLGLEGNTGILRTLSCEIGAERDGQWKIHPGDADVLAAVPSLNLTPEEKRVFGQLFRQADTDGLGVVTGEVAVKFFEKTRLEPRILGEVCAPQVAYDTSPAFNPT